MCPLYKIIAGPLSEEIKLQIYVFDKDLNLKTDSSSKNYTPSPEVTEFNRSLW